MTKTVTRINPTELPDSEKMGYSQISIVETGRTAYVSGQVAWSADGKPAPADLREQTKIAAANATTALKAIGANTNDIAMVRCFMVDLTPERLEQVFPILLEFFDGAQPSLTGVGVAALAGPDLQIELELTIALPN